MSAGGGKKSAGGPAAAATPVLLTGALALKVCDRILAQVVVCKEKDPVQLLELLLHDASLEEKLLQRVLCLGYTAAASRAMKEAAPKLAIERLLLARSAGEEATRLDAFSLLSHWALVRAAGWCWETINEITPEEAPEAQAVLHRATGKARLLPSSG